MEARLQASLLLVKLERRRGAKRVFSRRCCFTLINHDESLFKTLRNKINFSTISQN